MRQDRAKREKDLANLFDVLQNFPEFNEQMLSGIKAMKLRHGQAEWNDFRANLSTAFSSVQGEGVQQVEAQRPDPYGALVQGDPVNGPARFRELVYGRFREFLEKTGK